MPTGDELVIHGDFVQVTADPLRATEIVNRLLRHELSRVRWEAAVLVPAGHFVLTASGLRRRRMRMLSVTLKQGTLSPKDQEAAVETLLEHLGLRPDQLERLG